MSISLEYLSRTGLIREFLSIPCSVFATRRMTGEKVIFCIDKSENYLVKQWNLYQCKSDGVLPPFEEFQTQNVFDEPKIINQNLDLLEFRHRGFPTEENKYNHPMPVETFNEYFDGHLHSFANHEYKKEQWLWLAFLNIYHPQLVDFSVVIKRNLRFFGRLAEKEIGFDQRRIVQNSHPNSWKTWIMWKKYMLNFKGVPGELVFKSSFSKKE